MKALTQKLLAVILSLILISSILPAIPAIGQDAPIIEVESKVATAGQNVDIEIKILNSPGVTSTKVEVSYPEELTLTSVDFNPELGDMAMTSPSLASPAILNWVYGFKNLTGDFTFATLTFKVDDDATEGLKPITVTYDPDDIYNLDEDNINFAVEDGGIEVVYCLHGSTRTVPAVASTCCIEGHGEYTVCDECGAIIEGSDGALPLDPNNHISTETRNAEAATCTKTGYTGDTYCLGCNAKIKMGENIPAFRHNYVGAVTPPTCTEQGYTTYTCSRCGDSYIDDYTAKIDHTVGEWLNNTWFHWHICAVCGDVADEAEHILSDWIIDAEPQVGVVGSKHKECTVCKRVLQTGEIPPLLKYPAVSVSVKDLYTAKSDSIYSVSRGDGLYEIYNLNPTFTVVYSDKSKEEFQGNGVWKDDYYYNMQITCDVPYKDWELGVPYTCTATVFELSDTFTVTIQEVESIYVSPVEVIENWNGYKEGYWDSENQTWVENAWFYYYASPEEITVIMKDDKVINGTSSDIYNQLGIWPDVSSDQSYENQWGIGEHKATLSIGDCQTEYTVNITASPIASVEIDDVEITEYTHGYYEDDNYFYSDLVDALTVVMNDGRRIEFNSRWVQIGELSDYLDIDTSSQYNTPWNAGNTYEVTASILGKSCTFNVTVKETSITSIQMDDIEITEYTQGEWEDDQYIYNRIEPSGKAIMKDGSECVLKFDGSWSSSGDGKVYRDFEIDGEKGSLFMDFSSQYEEPWTAGNEYQIEYKIFGLRDSFNITIKETPITSIKLDDIEITEYTHGGWEDDQYIYEWFTLSGKAIMKDGSEQILRFNGSNSDYVRTYQYFEFDGEIYSILIDLSSQYEEPWTVGNTYRVDYKAFGVSDSFKITVIEIPIASVEIEDLTRIQGIDSYYNGSYDYYEIYPTYTVTFKDGTQQTAKDGDSIHIGDSYLYLDFDINQWESPLEVGKSYEITGKIGPAEDTFTLTIAENPVDWIEVLKNPDKTEYYVHEYPDIKGLKLRVYYKDKEYEDFSVDSSCVANKGYGVFSEKLQREDYLYSWDSYIAGEITVTKELFGKDFEIPITVREMPAVSLSVNEDENKSLVLTVTKDDGASEDFKIIAIPDLWIEDGFACAYRVITDKGYFEMDLQQTENGYVFSLPISEDRVIESNALEKSEWLEVALLLPWVTAEKGYNWLSDAKKEHYSGSLTAGNIDDTIRFIFESVPRLDWEEPIESAETVDEYGNYEWYEIYRGGFVKEILLKYLALDDIDLSLSDYYDPQTDTYRLICSNWGGDELIPERLEYKNGVWTAEYHVHWDETSTLFYVLNSDHKVIRIDNNASKPGDINGDGNVNNKDLTRLFQYLSGWDVDVNKAALDINGDGAVNNKDLTRFFQYLSGWAVEIY